MSRLRQNSNGQWARHFVEEVDQAVQKLRCLRPPLGSYDLHSDLFRLEALVLVLARAAELLAQERRLDPKIVRRLMGVARLSRGPAIAQILQRFEDRVGRIREASETPTAFLGMSYEALYGHASQASGSANRVTSMHRRDHGVYFTPPALAEAVTEQTLGKAAIAHRGFDLSILDPACGPATFLTAALNYLVKTNMPTAPTPSHLRRIKRTIAGRCLFGVDRDPTAVSVARTVLWLEIGDSSLDPATLTNRIVCGDSLTQPLESWDSLIPASARLRNASGHPQFDIILTNPPWGAVKPLRREFIAHAENLRAVGTTPWAPSQRPRELLNGTLDQLWDEYAKWTRQYAQTLLRTAEFARLRGRDSGDPDLYHFFMMRMYALLADEGRIGMVIPAGFQRAAGASELRRLYFENGHFEQITEIINRGRVFPIHGMFRFLLTTYQRGTGRGVMNLRLGLASVEEAHGAQPQLDGPGRLSLNFIRQVGGRDSMIPDVRTRAEVRLLRKLYRQHPTLGSTIPASWSVRFRRELDMTNDAKHFVNVGDARRLGWRECADGAWLGPKGSFVPVYEGRMIHQFDSAAKGYRNGQGRQAVWEPLDGDAKPIQPQFLVPIKLAAERRIHLFPRAAFCDVSGHANERTILASVVPAKAVCGNKVPVCLFEPEDDRLPLLWIAIANSFVIDWIIRRWVSTTINYFYWWNVPFPRLSPDSPIGELLVGNAAKLVAGSPGLDQLSMVGNRLPATPVESQQLRAEIDAAVAELFQLSAEEFAVILSDFPLVDRFQPRPNNGDTSITRDLAMLALLRRKSVGQTDVESLEARVRLSLEVGALGYIPSEKAGVRRRPLDSAVH